MNIRDELDRIIDALESVSIPYALCGGLAVVMHGYPRLTKDIDLLIEEATLEEARQCLATIGYSIEGGRLKFDIGTTDQHEIFRLSRTDATDFLSLDLLLVAPYFEEAWSSREVWRVGERDITVVSKAALIGMKRASGRPQDLVDIERLEGSADDGP